MSIDAINPEPQPSTAAKSGIVWISSYPRSGNTWIRMFLFNLSKIIAGEDKEQNINKLLEFSPWDGENVHYLKYLPPQSQGEAVPKDREAALARLASIASVRQNWQRELCANRSGPVFVKTHWILRPGFGYSSIDYSISRGGIYCVRNPLDVAVSLSKFFNQPLNSVIQLMGHPDAFLAGGAATDHLGSWSEHVACWTRKRGLNICVVRYEDLLTDPELWFGTIARHVFEPAPTADQVRRAVHRSAFEMLRSQEQQYGFSEMPGGKFFRGGRSGEWRSSLSSAHISQITGDHSKQMARFGYTNAAGTTSAFS
jgi:hypothetical protein